MAAYHKLHIEAKNTNTFLIRFGDNLFDWVILHINEIKKAGSLADCLRDKIEIQARLFEQNREAGREMLAKGAERMIQNYTDAWLILTNSVEA